jgi:hypothetical protein
MDLENPHEDGLRRKRKPVYDSSLVKALQQTFFYRWWISGILKLGSGANSGLL